MTLTEEFRKALDERGVKWWEDSFDSKHRTLFDGANGVRYCVYQLGDSLFIVSVLPIKTPAQAIAATVGNAHDLTGLLEEWERVLFANVQDEVVQDNLNNCVHALLDKAKTAGMDTCQIETTENWLPAERYHRCKHCGAFFAVLNASQDIPPYVCPNCGRRIEVES